MKISIVCATKNEEEDVHIALNSCLNQDFKNIEIIFVDDSSDSTPDIIKSYESAGVIYIKGDGFGCCEARNLGIKKSTGDIIVFTNADILLPPNYITKLAEIFSNPEIDIIVPDSEVLNMDSVYARYVQYLDDVDKTRRNSWTAQGYAVRKSAALMVGLISGGRYPFNCCRDWTLGYKMQLQGCNKLSLYSFKIPHKCPDNFSEFYAVRKERGRMSVFTKYFYEEKNVFFILVFILARVIKNLLLTLTGIRPLMRYINHRNSLKQLNYESLKFVITDILNDYAFTHGEFNAYLSIVKLKKINWH